MAPAGAPPALSERLRRFLAISATRHEAKGLQALAASCRADMQLGQATACLRVRGGQQLSEGADARAKKWTVAVTGGAGGACHGFLVGTQRDLLGS